MSVQTQSISYGKEELILETGRLAKQAAATVVATVGGTVVLVSVVADTKAREGADFFPLTVDYREKYYASGRFPGGFFKREARPGDAETLRARLIDRAIRPLFPKGFRNEVQVYVVVLSMDLINMPDTAALTAAGAALSMSNIPFSGPVAAVRVGDIDGELVLNPTIEEQTRSKLNMIVAGTSDAINMVESGANELPEARIVEALVFAHDAIKKAIEQQKPFVAAAQKAKDIFAPPSVDAALKSEVEGLTAAQFKALESITGKHDRAETLGSMREAMWTALKDKYEERKGEAMEIFESLHKRESREQILGKGMRADGRKVTDIRPISGEVGVLARTHGSAIFQRGETQALAVVTLGTLNDQQKVDDVYGTVFKRFMLHYNFPSYSVGETRRIAGPGRREIGHGSLAERAVLPVLPDEKDFPYTVRVVSEIMESNGSSSMASVCGATLSLMDAGVPIKKPVAGIAMGLIKEGDRVAVLSDILGSEDHLGDMDFKVTGTRDGVTALQMDIKISGVSSDLLSKALEQARQGRQHILGEMDKVLSAPRPNIAPHAPRLEIIMIDKDKIKDLIGPGGKTIRAIVEESGAKIDITDDGQVYIAAANGEGLEKALRMIKSLTAEVEVNTIYKGKVVRVTDFGAFVEILPNKDGLVHISELEEGRVERVEDVCKEGDIVTVKVIGIDEMGRIRLSRKAVLIEARGETYEPSSRDSGRSRTGGGDRGGSSGGGDRDRGGDRGGRSGGDRDRGPRREGGGDRDRGPRREGGGGGDRDRGPRREGGDEPREPREPREPHEGGSGDRDRAPRPDSGFSGGSGGGSSDELIGDLD